MLLRVCEICSARGAEPVSAEARALTRVLIEDRPVALCRAHLEEVERAGVETLSQLLALFPEPRGQRRAPERRSPFDRRIFPARPEGRRRGTGRRGTDAD